MSAPSGLQAERTTMAWQRTALGLGAVSALLVRHAGADLGAVAPGVAGLVIALVMLIGVEARHRRRRAAPPEAAPMGAAAVRSITWVTVLLALASALVVTGVLG